jgi:tetratricopeptide (TPR) repeat protein
MVCTEGTVSRRPSKLRRGSHPNRLVIDASPIAELRAKPAHYYGRDVELAALIALLSQAGPAEICIRGIGGVGKSALALTAMHDVDVASKFGRLRLFVRLDSATTDTDVVREIGLALGLHSERLNLDSLIRALKGLDADLLITLDNFETPWDSPSRTAVQVLLVELSNLSNVSFIVTLRGTELPALIQWTIPVLQPLKMLDSGDALQVLEAKTSRECKGKEWQELLRATDYLPQAIHLLSALVLEEGDPAELLRRWRKKATKALDPSSFADKDSSWYKSVEFSLDSPRVSGTPYASEMLSLLSLLPDGISKSDMVRIMAEQPELSEDIVESALLALYRVSLADRDNLDTSTNPKDLTRYVVSAHIREHMAYYHAPSQALMKPIVDSYLELSTLCINIKASTNQYRLEMEREIGNMRAIVNMQLRKALSIELINAVICLTEYAEFTGSDDSILVCSILERLEQAHQFPEPVPKWNEAHLPLRLGRFAAVKGRLEESMRQFQFALEVFRKAGSLRDVADCLYQIGLLESRMGDIQAALETQEEALKGFISVGYTIGQGDCLYEQGTYYARIGKLELAEASFEKAANLFRKGGSKTGPAWCLYELGCLSGQRAEMQKSVQHLEASFTDFEVAGFSLGMASCCSERGWRALRNDLGMAKTQIQEALRLFEECNNISGQSYSHLHLVELHSQLEKFEEASGHLEQAVVLSQKASDIMLRAECSWYRGNLMLSQVRSKRNEFALGDIGQLSQAEEALKEALGLYNEAGSVVGAGYSWLLIGRIHRLLRQPTQASKAFDKALAQFDPAECKLGCAECELEVGQVQTDSESAAIHFSVAVEGFRQCEAVFGEVESTIIYGETLNSLGRIEEIQEQLRRAADLCEQTEMWDEQEKIAKLLEQVLESCS